MHLTYGSPRLPLPPLTQLVSTSLTARPAPAAPVFFAYGSQIGLSVVQVWRGPRPVLVEPTSKALPARSRRPVGSRHLPLALLAASPVVAVMLWLWIDSPPVVERFA